MRKKLNILFIMSFLFMTMGTGRASEEVNEKETYSGVIISTLGQTASKSINVTIQIDSFTTDQEVMEFRDVFTKSGKIGLRRKLLETKSGRISPSGPLGGDIAIARIFSTDTGKLIQIVTTRIMPFLEVAIGGRVHDDKSCSFVEFSIDEEGKGTGSVYAVTQVNITEEGTLQIRADYHLQPFRLVNIQRIN